jgi:signal transduction histidine kinase
LAIVSHELKTPMTPILGWISLLKSDMNQGDPEMLGHALEVIERNAQAQSQLVNDLLDISRIVTGKLQLKVKDTDLAAVARFAVESLRPSAQAKAIELVLRINEPELHTLADAERLQQVVWNLLSNAIKFTPQSGQVVVSLLPAPILWREKSGRRHRHHPKTRIRPFMVCIFF